MRIVHGITLVVFASTLLAGLAGCASPSVATRGADSAVRAEPRRISDGRFLPDALRPGLQMEHRQAF